MQFELIGSARSNVFYENFDPVVSSIALSDFDSQTEERGREEEIRDELYRSRKKAEIIWLTFNANCKDLTT